ncbi:MAG: hypothetical protein JSS61_02730 [Verrucomicrobia bacterium]|nr:hypothetical protein [Verrucomicrobiota bacterium]
MSAYLMRAILAEMPADENPALRSEKLFAAFQALRGADGISPLLAKELYHLMAPEWEILLSSKETPTVSYLARQVDATYNRIPLQERPPRIQWCYSALRFALQQRGALSVQGFLPTTMSHFSAIEQELYDVALVKICEGRESIDDWPEATPGIPSCSPDSVGFVENDTLAAKAEKVRAWLERNANDRLSRISQLNFNYFGISVLPPEIARNFPQLKELDIVSNFLSDLDISGFTQLTALHASENRLSVLPKNSQLEQLSIANSDFTCIDLSELTSLKSLRVKENRLPDIDLSKSTHLHYLVISEDQLFAISNLSDHQDLHIVIVFSPDKGRSLFRNHIVAVQRAIEAESLDQIDEDLKSAFKTFPPQIQSDVLEEVIRLSGTSETDLFEDASRFCQALRAVKEKRIAYPQDQTSCAKSWQLLRG